MPHSVCAKHVNGVDCYNCEIQTYVNKLCSRRRDISLSMILHHFISLKQPELSLNVTHTRSEIAREFARNQFHKERLEFNEERDW